MVNFLFIILFRGIFFEKVFVGVMNIIVNYWLSRSYSWFKEI